MPYKVRRENQLKHFFIGQTFSDLCGFLFFSHEGQWPFYSPKLIFFLIKERQLVLKKRTPEVLQVLKTHLSNCTFLYILEHNALRIYILN